MEQREGLRIGTGTYISVGLVISIMGAVYMFGVQQQRLTDLAERVQRQESYGTDVATMKEQVRLISDTLREVRTDVRDIKEKQTVVTIKRP